MVEVEPLREQGSLTAKQQVATRGDYRPPWLWQQATNLRGSDLAQKQAPSRRVVALLRVQKPSPIRQERREELEGNARIDGIKVCDMTIRDRHPAQPWPAEQDVLAVPDGISDRHISGCPSDCPNSARCDVDCFDLAIGDNGQGTAVR